MNSEKNGEKRNWSFESRAARRALLALATLLALAPVAASAEVQLYAWMWRQGLFLLEPVTGQQTLVLASSRNLESLAYDPRAGTLFGVENTGGDNILVRIDPAAGTVTDIGVISGYTEITSATFDVVRNRLLAIDQSTRHLIELDPGSGAPSLIGSIGQGASNGLAAHPVTGEIYAAVRVGPSFLARLDPNTGSSTLIGSSGFTSISALAFHPETGTLHGDNRFQVVTFDLSTGAATPAGGFHSFEATALAFVAEGCPDPASIDYQELTAADCAAPQNSVTVLDQAQLDAYLSDFGFDGAHVRDVIVKFNPSGDVDIVSPCEVRIAGEAGFLDIQAERVCVYGRRGVTVAEDHGNPDQGIAASQILLVSEEGSAGFSKGLHLNADTIEVVAEKEAKVGLSCTVEAGSLDLRSTGDTPSSNALVRQGSMLTADSVTLEASREAKLGPLVVADVSGAVTLSSTGSAVGSVAAIEQSAVVYADSLSQTSGNKVVVGKNVVVDAQNAVDIAAAVNCSIAASAVIVGNPVSGNCME